MTKAMRFVLIGLAAAMGVFAGRSEADVVINNTRVVYPAYEKEVTMQTVNKGANPMLVQVWIDDGNEQASSTQTKMPFTVIPPLFRLESQKGQAVRILYTGEPLPTDKESLFWVNMLEVAPSPKENSRKNMMQFAVRTRIKLLFRPRGLSADGAFDAAKHLRWMLRAGEGGKTPVLHVDNPTPYYVNFARVGARIGEQHIEGTAGMVVPGGSSDFPIKELAGHTAADVQADFQVISDIGARVPYLQPLASQ